MTLLRSAKLFATDAHAGQYRESSVEALRVPYITHPIDVATRLVLAGILDEATVAAALLHDTVEDCGVATGTLREEFGDEVANLVSELTDPKDIQGDEKNAYQIAKAPKLSAKACHIKLADKASNITDILRLKVDWTRTEQLKYVATARKMVAAFVSRPEGLVVEFEAACRAVEEAPDHPSPKEFHKYLISLATEAGADQVSASERMAQAAQVYAWVYSDAVKSVK